jgi:hypothetical protein
MDFSHLVVVLFQGYTNCSENVIRDLYPGMGLMGLNIARKKKKNSNTGQLLRFFQLCGVF